MTPDKVREVIAKYRQHFEEIGVNKITYPYEEIVCSSDDVLGHCHGMLDKMLVFIEEDRMDKVFRWLGFIQGCLWTSKIYLLEDWKNHNRSS